jgi:transposase InsO family protein
VAFDQRSAKTERVHPLGFSVAAADQLWVSDITEHRTDEGKVYLTVVLGCFDPFAAAVETGSPTAFLRVAT